MLIIILFLTFYLRNLAVLIIVFKLATYVTYKAVQISYYSTEGWGCGRKSDDNRFLIKNYMIKAL